MKTRFAVLMAACLALCACSSEKGDSPSSGSPTWMLADMPADAVEVAALKQTAAEGDRVVVRGRIGGSVKPMSVDSAVFIMMDMAIPTCSEKDHDGCPTPWDYCCETPESKQANNATVQLVDASGRTLAIDLKEHGFKETDEIVVVGTVDARPSEAVLIIKAEKIHRVAG